MKKSFHRLGARSLTLAALCGTVALGVAACGSSNPSKSAGSSGASSSSNKTVAMLAGLANPFQADVHNGVDSVAQAQGYTVRYYNYDDNSQTEASDVSNIITSKPALVLYGVSNSSVSLANFRRLKAAGIPVVCFDVCLNTNVEQQYAHAFVTSNNTVIGNITGTLAAKYIRQHLGGSATVAYITCNTETVCQQRFSAQQQALKSVKLTSVANQAVIDPSQVISTVSSILQAHPDLQVIITDGLSETEGAAAAVKNQKAHAVVFGMDITPSIAQDLLVPGGPLQVAVGQDGVKIGQLAMQMGLSVLAGKEPSPFETTVPGKLYQRSDPATVRAYLAAKH